MEKLEGFVYLDYDNPIAAWNIARGVISTPDTLDETNKENFISISIASMLQDTPSPRLASELALEDMRGKNYPDQVSRLRGFFIFDDIESIYTFWETEKWGGHFQDKYLSDVGVLSKKSSRLDSNWIKYIWDKNGRLYPDWDKNAHLYWQGLHCPAHPPIWEKIIEGSITVWSQEVRKKALENVQKMWPNSLSLLHYACICAYIGDISDGQIFPYLNIQHPIITMRFLLKMKYANDPKFLEEFGSFLKANPQYAFKLQEEAKIHAPDLSKHAKVFLSVDYKLSLPAYTAQPENH